MRKILRLQFFFLLCFICLGWSTAYGQLGTVTGTVTDKQTGEKLPGANVFIEGTTIGASTDADGKYTLKVPVGKQVIICSYTGYVRISVILDIQSSQTITQNFSIAEDNLQLDEIVVVGYGTKRKRDITSSISSVKAQEIEAIPVENFGKALQGRTPGVQITSDNGLPGGGVTVRIRGTSSLTASSEPLYVVDGVPTTSGSYLNSSGFPDKSNVLSQIDPNDIESIEFLKDAAAAAIYGARSTNGVILITTKKGRLGEGKMKTQISANYYFGFTTVTNKLKVLDGPTYLALTKEAWFNSKMGTEEEYYKQLPYGIYNPSLTYEQNRQIIDNTSVDWINECLRTGTLQSASLSATGGSARTQFFLGGSYYGENGFLKDNSFQRVNGRFNFSHNATDWLTFGLNASISKTISKRQPTGWAGGIGTGQSRSIPIMPVYTPDGGYFAPKTSNLTNVVAVRDDLSTSASTFAVLANVYAEAHLTKWLSIREDFGIDNFYLKDYKYEGTITHEQAVATDRRVQVENYTNVISLNFNKTWKKHDVTAFLGYQVQNSQQNDVSLTGTDEPSSSLQQPNSASIITGSNWVTSYGFMSIIGRATYAYNNKYYATISLRRDASSRFGPGKKWGWFPAASVGWTLTEEKFVPDKVKKVLTYFKIRASLGQTGNSEIGDFSYVGLYQSSSYNGIPGIKIDRVGNPDLHWETTTQADIGFDFAFWSGRLNGGFDYYYKWTKEMLVAVNVPQTSGTSSIVKNVGRMDNKGIEIFINSNNLVGKFKWQTEFNINHNLNNVVDIAGQILAGENYGNNFAQEGHPIGAWRLVEYYGVDPQTGKELFVLADGSIGPWDDADPNFFKNNAKVVGNPYPTWFGGLNNIFSWKGIDASIFFTYQWGNNVYRDDGKFFEGGQIGSNWNQMATIEDHWEKPGDIATTPQLLWKNTYSTYNSTRYLDDGSFLRLKTVTIGYTLPANWTQAIKVSSIRVYIMAQNLWTLTKYQGWDPEVNRDGSGNITSGTTYLSPPQGKTLTVGINVNF